MEEKTGEVEEKIQEKPPSPGAKKKELASALTNDWQKLEDGKRVLTGTVSIYHKKFKGHGHQGPAVCIVACAFAFLRKMHTWTMETLDRIVECGDVLYLRSKQVEENRCREKLLPVHIYKYFFLTDIKVSMKVEVDIAHLSLFKDIHIAKNLENHFLNFLVRHPVGVFAFKERYFTFWVYHKFFFLFDPIAHDSKGEPWQGPLTYGYCCLFRFPHLDQLVEKILKFVTLHHKNRILLYPCKVEKATKVNTVPPETLDGDVPFEKIKIPKRSVSKMIKATPSTVVKEEAKAAPQAGQSGGVEGEQPQKKQLEMSESKIPPERPRLESVTNFQDLMEGKSGILRTYTSQNDPKFSKYGGMQSLANALAALSMLRVVKSKHWRRSTIYQILKLGETFHHEIVNLPVGEVPADVTIDDKKFTPEVQRYEGAIGCLVSTDDNILSLEQALANYLLDNDCVIVETCDHIVAIWKEENRFYIFNPNACDAEGKEVAEGAGVACVMWFTELKDLVAKFLSNIPPQKHKSRFTLCTVVIADVQERAENWYNFKALTLDKWILRGTFSQRDRRFPEERRNVQCTANAAMALAYKELREEQNWDSGVVDDVLVRGDELYRLCVEYLQEKGLYKNSHLMVDEIKRTFDVVDKRINLEIDDCLVNGIINASDDSEIHNLKRGFDEFFSTNEAGIVTANDQSMAVWKKDEAYYYYDSHSRDSDGIACVYGTACILRFLTISELTNMLLTNLGADRQNLYNISRIVVTVIDITDDGVVKPPLHNYQALSDYVAILRSNFSQKHKKFDLNVGKQTVPMGLAALAMNILIPSITWKQDDLDQVLVFGDKLYDKSMEANYVEELPPEMNVDDITTNNVKRDVKIGANLFQMDLEDYSQGNLEDNLKEAMESLDQRCAEEGLDLFQSIIESQYLTVVLWRDDNLYYLFDPQPRDERGQVYGKDDWSAKFDPEGEEYGMEETTEEEGDAAETEHDDKEDDDEDLDRVARNENEEEREKDQVEYEPVPPPPSEDNNEEDEDLNDAMDEEMEGEGGEAPPPPPPFEKKGSDYWRAQEEGGKACVVRFSRLEDLLNHILDNSPPNQRQSVDYVWKTIKITNTPVLHEAQDPEAEEKDEALGDWNDFIEYDRCRWILRGTKTMADSLYPECNRGKQEIPTCIVALAVASSYSMSRYKQVVVDCIMSYGDRLYTVVRRLRMKELKENKNLKLSDEEIEEIVKMAEFNIMHYPTRMCVLDRLSVWRTSLGAVNGDITSTIEEVPNVAAGLTAFFDEHTYGILQCKDYTVAVWRSHDIFYMYDSHPCGPSGFSSPVGVCCITRFCSLEDLADVFVRNLPKIGNHFFVVHAFSFTHGPCPRERQPEEEEKKVLKLGGFAPIMSGKDIIRGSIKHRCTYFTRGVNNQSAPIAFVALAVSLIDHPVTWTKAMVDAILLLGEDLYFESVARLADRFDPWADTLDIQRVNTDFTVGSMKANWAIRFKEQCGLVDAKNSKVLNLRQGLERFFEENSHGILLVQRLVLAIWEQLDNDVMHIYVFDPNSRGATGLPTHGGFACAVRFCNAKIAAEHLMACLIEEDKSAVKFIIVPVEIVIGKFSSKRKKLCKLVSSTRTSQKPWPKPYDGTFVSCPTKAVVLEEKRTLRRICEEETLKKQVRHLAELGRLKMYKINPNEYIIRGVRFIRNDMAIPVNYVAFFFMQISDSLDKWMWTSIDMIIQLGHLLYIDSCVAYKPPTSKLTLEYVLRNFRCVDVDVKLKLFRPVVCNAFTKENVVNVLNSCFIRVPSCIFNYDDYLVTVYFKSGFYYLFDPYSRDLNGNRTYDKDGSAMLMKFTDLEYLAEKLVFNLSRPPDEEILNFALVFLEVEYTNRE